MQEAVAQTTREVAQPVEAHKVEGEKHQGDGDGAAAEAEEDGHPQPFG